jgi:hypothetical protein
MMAKEGFAQTSGTLKFLRQGTTYTLRENDDILWTLDRRWFDSSTSPITIAGSDQVLKLRGRIAGTNLEVKLDVSIVGTSLAFSSFEGQARTVAISNWSGQATSVPIELRLAKSTRESVTLTPVGRRLAASLMAPFEFSIETQLGFSGTDAGVGEATKVTYATFTTGDELSKDVLALVPGARPLSSLVLHSVRTAGGDGWRIGSVGKRILRMFFAQDAGQIALDTVSGKKRFVIRKLGTTNGNGNARIRYGEERFGRDIHVAEAELIKVVGGDVGLRIGSSAETFYIEAERFTAAIRIKDPVFFPRFDGASKIALPIQLMVLHVRSADEMRVDIDFRTIKHSRIGPAPGQPGLNRSAIVWDTRGTVGLDATLTLGVRSGGETKNWLHLGKDDAAEILLHHDRATTIDADSPIFRIRRESDALDLGLLFYNFRLTVGTKTSLAALAGAKRGVRFHPQHLEEECFSDPVPTSAVADFLKWVAASITPAQPELPSPSTRRAVETAGKSDIWFPGGSPTMLARTQVAGASRIVFESEAPKTIELSAATLTRWSGLKISSSPRAIGEIAVEEQLSLIAVEQATSRDVARGLVSETLRQPASDHTSLEPVTGLFIEPQNTAHFRTSDVSPGGSVPLWTAQLDLKPINQTLVQAHGTPRQQAEPIPNAVVRAVWATGLEPCTLFGLPCEEAGSDPFTASTSRSDRIQIAVQSSVFGLAAMRAVTLQGADVPGSRVRRVSDKWKFISEDKVKPPGAPDDMLPVVQEGVYSPVPFKQFQLRMTSVGADLDAEWESRPLKAYRGGANPDPFFKLDCTVERYVHRTRMRSDSLAEVYYEGFLFPYGFAVSLLKSTPREPRVFDEFGAMMPLITRYYIIPKPITKTYPGIYQPFGGREIPAGSARLLSERSPELDDTMMGAPVGMNLPDLPSDLVDYRVFWPMLKTGGKLPFDFTADDLGTRRTLPMLFVSGADANFAPSIREVMRYYNALEAKDRLENHHGASTIFAPARKSDPGATSFETDHITVAARPRFVSPPAEGQPQSDDAPFTTDAFMNGANEPPFYPVMVEASICVPPLDRILGTPKGFRRVGYNSTYIQNGFDGSNRSEIYLNFLDDGTMALGDNGRTTGGLAQPSTSIAGISRISTILGASPNPDKSKAALAGGGEFPPVGSDAQAPWNLATVAEDHRFEPAEYFRGARLLGAVDLAKVVEAAGIEAQPKLKEVYEYALGKSGALDALKLARDQVVSLIGAAIKEADVRLKQIFTAAANNAGAQVDPADVSVQRFYPDLFEALTGFAKTLGEELTADTMPTWATNVITEWRPVKAAVDAVIANPSPEPLREGMAELRAFIDALQVAFGKGLGAILQNALADVIQGSIDRLVDAVVAQCFDATGTLASPWFFEAVAGYEPLTSAGPEQLRKALQGILANPEVVTAQVRQAALGPALMVPLLTALSRISKFAANLADLKEAAVRAVAQEVTSVLQSLISTALDLDQLVAAARKNAANLCIATGGSLKLEDFCRIILDLTPSGQNSADGIARIRSAWPALDLPAAPSSPALLAVRQASGRLRARVEDLDKALKALEGVRASIAALDLADVCAAKAGQIPALMASLVTARNAAVPAVQRCSEAAASLLEAYAALPADLLEDALDGLEAVRRRLIGLVAGLTWQELVSLEQRLAWLDAVPVVGDRVRSVKAEAITQGTALRQLVADSTQATSAELAAVVIKATQLASVEQKLVSLATDFAALTGGVIDTIEALRADLTSAATRPLAELHESVLKLSNQTIEVFDGAPELIKLFTRNIYKKLLVIRDHLQKDRDALNSLATSGGSAELISLLERWRTGHSGLSDAAAVIVDFFNGLMSGQIGGVFDLEGVRRAAEEAVRQLIPTRVNLAYDWTGKLKSYEIFEPKDAAEITLKTRVSVDLLDPASRKIDVTGEISPFDLKLIGKPDLVTIGFSKTTFGFDGNVPRFDTHITSVEPGEDLKFFKSLSQLLGDNVSNIYAEPLFNPDGLRVGYRYSQELIDLGGVQFTNFGFDASLSLFLNGKDAQIRFAIASREKPCGLIIAPAYYGAGFVSLTTTAKQVTAFEIQLQFGAARALKFGPLNGFGAVSAGIYLRQAVGAGMVLEGFVHAVGEASIACFGVSVNFEVKVVHVDGNVTGQASYSFSFRVGFVKISYGVTAQYSFDGGGGGGGTGASQPAASRATYSAAAPHASLKIAPASTPVPEKTKDWLAYRDNFVKEWPA